MSKQEKNQHTLLRAIAELPLKEAPAGSWTVIIDRLDEAHQFDQITASARHLPTLPAPDHTWESIEQELARPTTTRTLWPSHWLGWAAALVLALTAAWYAWPPQPEVSVTVSVNTEEADPSLLATDWDADEAAFATVTALYRQHQEVFTEEQPDRNWLAELQELNDARAELKAAIQTYGRDAILLNQLADIERERSAILKKMAQHI